MLPYQTQLLEAICDKLGIDYAEMKAAEIKRLEWQTRNIASAKNSWTNPKRDRRKTEPDGKRKR